MKLTKKPIKKSLKNTENESFLMNKNEKKLKISYYSNIQIEEDSFLYQMALEEYNDLFPEILILSQNDFFSFLEKYIKINLATSDKNPSGEAIKKILFLIKKNYYDEEKDNIEKKLNINNSPKSYIKYTENNFIPHCKYTKEAIHSCGEKLYLLSKYYYCIKCNMIYKPDYILLKCDKCNSDYYTEIENKNLNTNMYLKSATWVKYHCNALINDTMRCFKCQNSLYLNTKNNILYCIKCNFEMNQNNIKWKCILCNQLFTSEAKIYNRYEYKIISLAIKKTLFKGVEAKPLYLPCCNIYGEKVKSYKFFHKNECNGLLYLGDLKEKKIVVCSKCHMLNLYENQYWLCPICKVRFQVHIKNNISVFDSPKNNEPTKQIEQNRETINNKEIYIKNRKNNLSIELKKTKFKLCDKEKEKNENKEEKENISAVGSRKEKIFSARNKPKKINYSNNKYYNNFVNININDYSHIYSNYKRSDSSKNEIGFRFQTIQDNKGITKEKEKEYNLMMTNYKNNENKKFNIIFKRDYSSKLLNGFSRNLKNIEKIKNIYPPQLLQIALAPTPNNLDIKPNYFNYKKKKKNSMFKHHRTKYSFDQGVISSFNNDTINKKINKNKLKNVIGFDRVLSQKELF